MRRQQMPLQVMHAERRHAPAEAQRLRQRSAGQQCTDQPGSGRVGDAVDLRGVVPALSSALRTSGSRRRR